MSAQNIKKLKKGLKTNKYIDYINPKFLSVKNFDYMEEQTEDDNVSFLTDYEGVRYPMKIKINIDPKIKISQDQIRLPHIVQIRGEINEEMAINIANDINIAENTGQEILPVYIDSPGGEIYSALSIGDLLRNCSLPIATMVCGKAMSAGAFLFSFGHDGYRFMSPNSTIMLHEAHIDQMGGKNVDVQADAQEMERLNRKLLEMMADNCGHSKDFFISLLKKKNNTDVYLDASLAKKYKLANHIKIPQFNINIEMSVDFV